MKKIMIYRFVESNLIFEHDGKPSDGFLSRNGIMAVVVRLKSHPQDNKVV